MRCQSNRVLFGTGVLLFSIARATSGSEIFHWVDEDGVLHYSDWAPANPELEVSKLVISESNPRDYDPEEDPNSILSQAGRTNERWEEIKEEIEQRREERREQLSAAPPYQPPIEYYYDDRYYDSSPWFYYPGRPIRPGRPPGVVHPEPFKTATRQAVALERLGLSPAERPYSINSSAHHERVNAGVTIDPGSRPQRPARPARPSHHQTRSFRSPRRH